MHTNFSQIARNSTPARLVFTTGAVALLGLAGVASAGPLGLGQIPHSAMAQAAMVQVGAQATDAGFVVVTQGGANMRCSDSDRFYVVARIPEGTVLKSEGASGNWTIVRYPANTPAFVRVEHVRVEGDVATTTEATQLKALNAASGFSGSYKSLLNQALPAGSRLKVIEAVREGDGPVVAYKVVAPDSARGFIDGASLRVATEAEARAAAAAMGIAPRAETPVTPPSAPATTPAAPATPPSAPATTPAAPATPPSAPATTPATTPSETPATPPPAVVDLTQPGGVPAATPSDSTPTAPTTPTAEPVTINQGGTNPDMPAATPTTPTPMSPGDVAPVDPATRRVGTVEQLEQTFQRVWREPIMSSEVDELIAEYDRAIGRETSEGRRRALTQRLEALKIRKDFRDRSIRQQEDVARYDQSKQVLTEQLLIVERGRVYTIIGELQPSTVYDGDRLPLMFRVVSVGGVAPRTLGYLRPTQDFTLREMVGQVVGVIGDATLDPSLKLNVITPVRVDVMRPGELGRVETREIPWPGEATRPATQPPTNQPASGRPGTIQPVPPAPSAPPTDQSGEDSESFDPPAAPSGGDSGDGLVPVPPR
jgi:hypothetical protein